MRHRKALSQALTLVGALAAAACTGRIELPGGVQVETVSPVTEAQAAATAPSDIPVGIQVRSQPGFLLGGSYKTMLQWVEKAVAVTVDCKCPAPEALRIAGRLQPYAGGRR